MEPQAPEVTYRWAGIDDAGQRVPDAWFEDIVGWALEALAQSGEPTADPLPHGHQPRAERWLRGAPRTGWDPVEAIEAIRRRGPEGRAPRCALPDLPRGALGVRLLRQLRLTNHYAAQAAERGRP